MIKKKQKLTILSLIIVSLTGVVVVLLIFLFNSFNLKGVVFSENNGFYDENIRVEIKPDGMLLFRSVDIKYNMNGDDLNNTSELYTDAIELEVPEVGYKVYTITAIVCEKNGECVGPEVATYVLGKNLNEDVTLDIININSSQYNLYDYYKGIMVGGRTYDLNDRLNKDNGSSEFVFIGGNYNNRGKKWARDAYITSFDTDGKLVWDEDGYLEISGGTSAAYEVKSLKITLKKCDEPEENCTESFRLRSGSQDQFSGNIRSSVASRLVENSGFDGGTDTKRVVVFLNGDYYGIFDAQKNFSELNIARKFNIEKEKKIEKNKGSEIGVFEGFMIPNDIWNDLDSQANRDKLEELIDMEDYLMYFAVQILLNNTDWPMNNFEAWRYNGKNSSDNKYEDGRLRFLMYDTDLIYYTDGNIDWFPGSIGDIFRFLMERQYRGAGSSFYKVMKSDYYRQKFINILKELLEGPFDTENIIKIIDEEADKIDHQVKLFSSEKEYTKWQNDIELMRKAVLQREETVKNDVLEFFGVEL